MSSSSRLQSARRNNRSTLEKSEKKVARHELCRPSQRATSKELVNHKVEKSEGVTKLTEWNLQQTLTSWAPFTHGREEETQKKTWQMRQPITPCAIPSLSQEEDRPSSGIPTMCLKHVPMSKYRPTISDDRDQLTTKSRNQDRARRADWAPNQDEAEPRALTSHSEQSPWQRWHWSFLAVHAFSKQNLWL